MKKPPAIVVLPLLAAVYVPPLIDVAKQAANGDTVTQKLPPAYGIQVATSASSTDTGVDAIAVTVDMNTGKRISFPQPQKPGQVQLPITDAHYLDTGDITDTG
jgi:hypothetical protein